MTQRDSVNSMRTSTDSSMSQYSAVMDSTGTKIAQLDNYNAKIKKSVMQYA